MTGRDLAKRDKPTGINGEVAQKTPPPAALDAHIQLLDSIDECKDMLKYWENRKNQLNAQLAVVMGPSTVGTVDGVKVVNYESTDRFRGSDFRKQYPDTWRSYIRPKMVDEFDAEALQAERPELWAEFCSRPMTVTWKRKQAD